jgi:hypothetical protein
LSFLQTYLKEKWALRDSNPKEFSALKEAWQRKRKQQSTGGASAGGTRNSSSSLQPLARGSSLGNSSMHRTNPLATPSLGPPAGLRPPQHAPQARVQILPQPHAAPLPSPSFLSGSDDVSLRRAGPGRSDSGSLRHDNSGSRTFRRVLQHSRPAVDASLSRSLSGSERPATSTHAGVARGELAKTAVKGARKIVPTPPTPVATQSLKRSRPSGGDVTPSARRERPQ